MARSQTQQMHEAVSSAMKTTGPMPITMHVCKRPLNSWTLLNLFTLIAIAAFEALATIAVAIILLMHLNTPLVNVSDPLLRSSLLLGLVITFLCSIAFLGEPQMWSCMTSQVALAVGFALSLSSLMGKSALLMLRARAVKAVKAAKAAATASEQSPDTAVIVPAIPQKNDVDPIHPRHQRAIMIVCTLIQAVGCTVWLILMPPCTPRKEHSCPEHQDYPGV